MDATPTLEALAALLPNLPRESVEDLLVTFDALTAVSDDAVRPTAAQLLQKAAESSQDPERLERLLRAASAIAAREPCALTAGGLTAQQAAAAQTVTQAEWDERVAGSPLPPPPGEDIAAADHDAGQDEDVDAEDSPYMKEAPPQLPHLRVRHFFRGLVFRTAQDFREAFGRPVCRGDLLTLLLAEQDVDSYSLACMERTVRLSGPDAIVENAGNAWFQPVPTTACLEALAEAIDLGLSELEEDDDVDGNYDDVRIERLAAIREDFEQCQNWLSISRERGPSPQPRSGPLAGKVFGKGSELAAWIPLFFAAVAVAIPDPAP